MCDFKDKFENVKHTVLAHADDFVSKLAKNFHEFRVMSEEKRVSNFNFDGIKLYSGTDNHGKYFELRNKKTFARFHKKDGEQVVVYLQKKKGDNKVHFRALSSTTAPVEETPVTTSDTTSSNFGTSTDQTSDDINKEIENEIDSINKEIKRTFDIVSGATDPTNSQHVADDAQEDAKDIEQYAKLLFTDDGVTAYTSTVYDTTYNGDLDMVPMSSTKQLQSVSLTKETETRV